MKPEFENIPLKINEKKHRFEIEVNGHFAFINFKLRNNIISLIHTEAEPELLGTGAAQAVVEKTLQYIKDNELLALPYCPYILAFIQKHPDWKDIVDPNFIENNPI